MRTFLVTAFIAFLVLLMVGSVIRVGVAQQGAPATGAAQIAQLDCPENNGEAAIIYLPPAQYPGDQPLPTATSPENALAIFLAERFAQIPARAFERFAEAAERVQFAVERNGALKASALAEQVSDGWLVQTLAVCGDFLG